MRAPEGALLCPAQGQGAELHSECLHRGHRPRLAASEGLATASSSAFGTLDNSFRACFLVYERLSRAAHPAEGPVVGARLHSNLSNVASDSGKSQKRLI